MRLGRSHWSWDTVWCALTSHTTPAATVARLEDGDSGLGIRTENGRLCRCLRCDAWVNFAEPDPAVITSQTLAPTAELPRPLRGRALEERLIVRIISVQRWAHVALFVLLLAVLMVVDLKLPVIQRFASDLQGAFEQQRPASGVIGEALEQVLELTRGHVGLLMLTSAAYAVLEGVEAFYLWRGERWAEYLTVLATGALLPLTIKALLDGVTVFKTAALVIDVAILAYLIIAKRLFGVRGGAERLERELAEDVNWDSILTTPPRRAPDQHSARGRGG